MLLDFFCLLLVVISVDALQEGKTQETLFSGDQLPVLYLFNIS